MLSELFRKFLEILGLAEKEETQESPETNFFQEEFFVLPTIPEDSSSEVQEAQDVAEKREQYSGPVSPDEIPVGVERGFWLKYAVLLVALLVSSFLAVQFIRSLFLARPVFGVKTTFLGTQCHGSSCVIRLSLVIYPKSTKATVLSISNLSIDCSHCRLLGVNYSGNRILANLQLLLNNRSYYETLKLRYHLRYKLWFFVKSEDLAANLTINLTVPTPKLIRLEKISSTRDQTNATIYHLRLWAKLSEFPMPVVMETKLNASCDNPWTTVSYPSVVQLSNEESTPIDIKLRIPAYVYLLRKRIRCWIYATGPGFRELLANLSFNLSRIQTVKQVRYSVSLISRRQVVLRTNADLSCNQITAWLSNVRLAITNCSVQSTGNQWKQYVLTLATDPLSLASKLGIAEPRLILKTPYFIAQVRLSWISAALQLNSLGLTGNTSALQLNITLTLNCSNDVNFVKLQEVECKLACSNTTQQLQGYASNLNLSLTCNRNDTVFLVCKFAPNSGNLLRTCLVNSSIQQMDLQLSFLVNSSLGSYLQSQGYEIRWNTSS